MAGAVAAYAAALNGWPTTSWAGETTLKLARALDATDRKPQACGALGEFNRRYAATASASLKTIAGQVRTQAACSLIRRPQPNLQARIDARLDARLQHDVAHPVALALSGGGDSMALLRIAADWARRRGRRLLAVTVDHGLNAGSRGLEPVLPSGLRGAGRRLDRAPLGRRQAGDRPARRRPDRPPRADRRRGARGRGEGHPDGPHRRRHRRERLDARAGFDPGVVARMVAVAGLARGARADAAAADAGASGGRLCGTWLRAAGQGWIEDPANADARFGRSQARAALTFSHRERA